MRLILGLLISISVATAGDPEQVWSVNQAMKKLQDGNTRFVKGRPNVWDSGSAKRETLAVGQTPYACVITCADSRVPPEEIFDAGLGELFVIRVAGNVTPVEVMASADYAVGHLGCPVVVVLGHTSCGAVGAALSESEFPEPLNTLVSQIRPSVHACLAKGYNADELYEGAIKENARAGAASLVGGSRNIEQAVTNGDCIVLSAVYDLKSGEVSWHSQVGAVALAKEESHKKNSNVTDVPAPTKQHDERSHQSVAKTEKTYPDSTRIDKSQSSRQTKQRH